MLCQFQGNILINLISRNRNLTHNERSCLMTPNHLLFNTLFFYNSYTFSGFHCTCLLVWLYVFNPCLYIRTSSIIMYLLHFIIYSFQKQCLDYVHACVLSHFSHGQLCNHLPGLQKKKTTQSCPTLCHPMDCSLPGSSVHGVFQAIVLEWIAISFSRDLPNPGIEPWSPTL